MMMMMMMMYVKLFFDLLVDEYDDKDDDDGDGDDDDDECQAYMLLACHTCMHPHAFVHVSITMAAVLQAYGHRIASPSTVQYQCQQLVNHGDITHEHNIPLYLHWWPSVVLRTSPESCSHFQDLFYFSSANKYTRDVLNHEIMAIRVYFIFLWVAKGSDAKAGMLQDTCCKHIITGGSINEIVDSILLLVRMRSEQFVEECVQDHRT